MNKSQPPSLYPLTFAPVLKDYIWGGRNLERYLGRELPDGRVAESWDIAAHEDGVSIVTNGPYAGLPLTAVHDILGPDLIGSNNLWAQERGKFPLLVKLLDAQERLSIQVHPNDDYALANEGNELGKTEMWVVLHAAPEAAVILGVRSGVTPQQFREAITDGTLENCLHIVPVKVGDAICVPSGTVHAIMGGLVIAEIQQNSNTTYRVYDWNRTQDGVPRPLHIDKAMDVIDFEAVAPRSVEPQPVIPRLLYDDDGVRRRLLCRNRYFTTERVELVDGAEFHGELNGQTLEIWGAIESRIDVDCADGVQGVQLDAVQFALLPAALGPFRVKAEGAATCLRTYVEDAPG